MFRASSKYTVVLVEQLPAPQQATIARIAGADGIAAAVLVPTAGDHGGRVKLVGRDTVDLLDRLSTPGPLPWDMKPDNDVLRLLLDHILEVEVNGAFLSGIEAHAAFRSPSPSPSAAAGRLAHLSVLALRHAQRLPIIDADRLAAKLYSFNRRPVSREAKRTWPDRHAMLAALCSHTALEPAYRLLPAGSPSAAWVMWSGVPDNWNSPRSGTYKLYISPAPEDLPQAFAALVPQILRLRPTLLKVGGDAYGVCRPDKLVVYFEDLPSLTTFADTVAPLLCGCEPHGVPFTAELAGDGLLSWGIDPPRSESSHSPLTRDSWRSWLVSRLARAIIEARRGAGSGVEPWQFAMARIDLEGVDTTTWRPHPSIWQRTGKA